MAEINCAACEELRQTSPEFIVNGLTDEICSSLANDTGLSPSDDHNDCTDLHNLNDCLVGNEATEVDAYDVCDWKPFMKQFIPNLWTVLKAIICAICGIWTNIHKIWEEIAKIWEKINCVYGGLKALGDGIAQTIGGQSFIRYFRDNSGTATGGVYQWNVRTGSSHYLDIFMDCDVDNPGSTPADRDYVVIISNCTDIHGTSKVGIDLTFFSSGDTRSMALIRKRQAQHPHINLNGASVANVSWPTTGAVLIRKGEHVRVEGYVYAGNSGWYRLHQFVLTWIPVNASGSFDPSAIIPQC